MVYPAVDLRGGHAVQLVGGRTDAERVRLPDPAAVAAGWVQAGFRALHVVDLDAALGRGHNRAAVAALIRQAGVPVQVGGGVRDRATAEELLALGADRVVVGTRAVEDPDWLAATAAALPDRLVVALDSRGGRVVTRGWTRETDQRTERLLAALDGLPLAGVLVTDVGREGRMQGADVAGFAALAGPGRRVIASGGITRMDDLRALSAAGMAGAVLGMALYTGALDAAAVVAALDTL
jgi:phosphoribosylformimino-5-aminoimidazole carboxamide ribotide isomerase